MANIVVNKMYSVNAVEIETPAGFSSPQGNMLPLVNTANAVAVNKIIEGEPRLVEATYYGTKKVAWREGLHGCLITSQAKVDLRSSIDNWDSSLVTDTAPLFMFDNNISRTIATKMTIEPTAFLLQVDSIDVHTLEKISSDYTNNVYYNATSSGLTTRCEWQKYTAGDSSDFFLVPWSFYSTNAVTTFTQQTEVVKPTYTGGNFEIPFTQSPMDYEQNILATLPMGDDFTENPEVVFLGEGTLISTETVPENAPLNTIFVSGFKDSNGKIVPRSVACRAWGVRQFHSLYPSWAVDPEPNVPYLYVNSTGDFFKSYFKNPKTSSWGNVFQFSINARTKIEAFINKPLFGLSKWELNLETNKFSQIQYGRIGDSLPSVSFPILGQNENTGEYFFTGRLPNLTYFYGTLKSDGSFVNEKSFSFNLGAKTIADVPLKQIGYSYNTMTGQIPAPAVNEIDYTIFNTASYDTYSLSGVATGVGKTLVQNIWGRTLIWTTVNKNNLYAMFRNGAGFIDVDLTPLGMTDSRYVPHSFKQNGRLILFVWFDTITEEYIYKVAYLAIWLESEVFTVNIERIEYSNQLCYRKRLGKGSPLTKVR